MSDSERPARPRQVTLAGGVVVGASLFLVVSVFDAMTNLNSVDVRDQLRELVTSSTGRDLGLSLDDAVNGMRIGLSVTAVCAAAAAVLGVFVFAKHRGARIGLSVLAVPLVLTAPLTGGFLGVLVAVATAMLWQRPVKDWYDGRPAREGLPTSRRAPGRPVVRGRAIAGRVTAGRVTAGRGRPSARAARSRRGADRGAVDP